MASDGLTREQFGHLSLMSAPHRMQRHFYSLRYLSWQLAHRTEGLPRDNDTGHRALSPSTP
jgi:hypothetical protein